MNCNICKIKQKKSIYYGKVRVSSNSLSQKKYRLVLCEKCELISFEKFMKDESFYVSGEYRKQFDKGLSVSNFKKKHQKREFDKLNFYNLKKKDIFNKVVAELGCGSGILLDHFKQNGASKTVAVERAIYWRSYLENKHHYFSDIKKLYLSNLKIDLITSFAEVEHMQNPLEYCKLIYKSLNKNGKLLIRSPNYDNIYRYLLGLDYDIYDIRSSHFHYFNEKSLTKLLVKSGFSLKNIKADYFNEYDLDNLIKWTINKKISKKNLNIQFSENLNFEYHNYLRKNKLSNCLAFTAIK